MILFHIDSQGNLEEKPKLTEALRSVAKQCKQYETYINKTRESVIVVVSVIRK